MGISLGRLLGDQAARCRETSGSVQAREPSDLHPNARSSSGGRFEASPQAGDPFADATNVRIPIEGPERRHSEETAYPPTWGLVRS